MVNEYHKDGVHRKSLSYRYTGLQHLKRTLLGFEDLLLDAVVSTSNTAQGRYNPNWKQRLSPAMCPPGSCKPGGYVPTQTEMYDRMDLICALGITDLSVFPFTPVDRMVKAGDETWTNAIRYFKYGTKLSLR